MEPDPGTHERSATRGAAWLAVAVVVVAAGAWLGLRAAVPEAELSTPAPSEVAVPGQGRPVATGSAPAETASAGDLLAAGALRPGAPPAQPQRDAAAHLAPSAPAVSPSAPTEPAEPAEPTEPLARPPRPPVLSGPLQRPRELPGGKLVKDNGRVHRVFEPGVRRAPLPSRAGLPRAAPSE